MGDFVLYSIGYKFGRGLAMKHPRLANLLHAEREERVEKWIRDHGLKILFVVRFMVFLRAPIYLAVGILRMPARQFVAVDALCAAAVVGTFFGLSYRYGDQIKRWIHGSEVCADGRRDRRRSHRTAVDMVSRSPCRGRIGPRPPPIRPNRILSRLLAGSVALSMNSAALIGRLSVRCAARDGCHGFTGKHQVVAASHQGGRQSPFRTAARSHQRHHVVVLHARDRQTDRVVGLKLLDVEKTALFEARFTGLKRPREGEIGLLFDHPYIVKTLEHGITTEGQQFVVMEFLEGPGLNSLIVKRSRELEGLRLTLLRQAGEALRIVHEAGFIHRDVCPRNFVLDRAVKNLKLIDFGLTVPATAPFMQPGNRTGTPNYMAPELVRRRKPISGSISSPLA